MKLTVEVADRVDKALAKFYPAAGRRALAELFDDGSVKVAGKRAKKGDRVVAGDVIELAREPVHGDALRPAPDPEAAERLAVLLERSDLVAVAKPAGMPSQPLRPGELGTAANGIVFRYPECVAVGDDPRDGGLVHRLDIGTSGVLVAARTAAAHRGLRDAFGAGLVDKQYFAIVEGRPVSRECDAPLVQRGKRVVVDHTDGLAAFTAFTVERATETHALVRCAAQSGRMHQVRAHLATVGAPIAGDELYGAAAIAEHPGFFLHGARIEFPLAGERLVIEAPLPARFTAALAALGLALVLAACGGHGAAQPTAPVGTSHDEPADLAATAQPLVLPDYPNAEPAGAQGGPGPVTQRFMTTDPVDTVRAFYIAPHLPGFQVSIDAATREVPRHITDAAGHRAYTVAVYDEGGVTMIELTTTILP